MLGFAVQSIRKIWFAKPQFNEKFFYKIIYELHFTVQVLDSLTLVFMYHTVSALCENFKEVTSNSFKNISIKNTSYIVVGKILVTLLFLFSSFKNGTNSNSIKLSETLVRHVNIKNIPAISQQCFKLDV